MGKIRSQPDRKIYESIPKIELHRHLEGAIRSATLFDLAGADEDKIVDVDGFKSSIKIDGSDNLSYENFLSKFKPLRKFYKSPETIKRIVGEAIEDAAADNILYMELRFSPSALSYNYQHSARDVIKWVTESSQEASKRCKIETRLIVSLIRHEPLERAEEICEAALGFQDQGIVGIDLAGDEVNYPAGPFLTIFEHAQKAGLRVTLHAGEWAGAENVFQAIDQFKAERIGHGIRVLDDEFITKTASASRATFEVCITSNYHSGVVTSIEQHPIKEMLGANLNITINTDDPQISQITMTDELMLLNMKFGFSFDQIRKFSINAINAAFIGSEERNSLLQKYTNEFAIWQNNYLQHIPV
jgi:adenosine deaminase